MSQRVIAIGDIHGCATALRTLLEAIQPQAEDTLVVLGDVVDRGPDSRNVLEQLLALREVCKLVLLYGNHEEMMVNFLENRPLPDDWLMCGGEETLLSYANGDDSAEVPITHVEFMRTWLDYYETDTHIFVHACYEPLQPLSMQPWQVMRWQSIRDAVPGPHISEKTAIVGHTSQKNGEVLDAGHLVCIDTFCCGGFWLTAIDAASGQIWQANDQGELRS